MTDRVPRLPLEEIRQLLDEFGSAAVDEALRVAKLESKKGDVHYSDNGSLSDASTTSADFDKYRIQEAMLEVSFYYAVS